MDIFGEKASGIRRICRPIPHVPIRIHIRRRRILLDPPLQRRTIIPLLEIVQPRRRIIAPALIHIHPNYTRRYAAPRLSD